MWGRAHLDTVEVMKNELNGTMSKNSKGSFSISTSIFSFSKENEGEDTREGWFHPPLHNIQIRFIGSAARPVRLPLSQMAPLAAIEGSSRAK